MKKLQIGMNKLIGLNRVERKRYIQERLKRAAFDLNKEITVTNDSMSLNIIYEQDNDA